MTTIVFLLEEPSAEALLHGVLPRLLPAGVSYRCIPFEGKQDLHKQLERKLRSWLAPNTRFIVMRDQDSGDCVAIKEELSALCRRAGKPEALVRIACRELESFYLGDLQAVEQGLGINALAAHQENRKYRLPDELGNPSEELIQLTRKRYQKLAGSRSIAPQLRLDDSNRSHSFKVLLAGIRKVAAELTNAG